MLLLITNTKQLSYSKLMEVYKESVRSSGKTSYRHLSEGQQMHMAEIDLYAYLNSVLGEDGATLAVWAPEEEYKAAVRVELYRDGLLLSGIETAPEARRQGYAKALLMQIIQHWKDKKIYAHIDSKNFASIRLHESCGFIKALDHAVFLDGSITSKAKTYVYQK